MTRTIGVGEKESLWCPECHVVFVELASDVKDKDAIPCPHCQRVFPSAEIRAQTKRALSTLHEKAEEQRQQPGRHRGYSQR